MHRACKELKEDRFLSVLVFDFFQLFQLFYKNIFETNFRITVVIL